MPWPWMAVLGSLPAAALGSAIHHPRRGALVGRWMPTMETYARRTGELVGTAGEATYDIDHQFGMANVRDLRGDLFQVACRVYPDGKPIQKGTKVLLVDYNDDQKWFFVTPYDVMRTLITHSRLSLRERVRSERRQSNCNNTYVSLQGNCHDNSVVLRRGRRAYHRSLVCAGHERAGADSACRSWERCC